MDYLLLPSPHYPHHDTYDRHVDARLLFLGSRGVGKSALIVRYITKRFIGDYDNSFDARYMTTLNVNNRISQIEFIDPVYTQQETDEMQRNHVIRSDGIVLVYSVTDRNSFYNITLLYEYICSTRPHDTPSIILVANKIDLHGTRTSQVTSIEGQQLAQKLNCDYFETSAAVLTIGYASLCEAVTEISECVLQRQVKRKSSNHRKKSLSPKPLRKAIGKMFGRNHREECDQITAFS